MNTARRNPDGTPRAPVFDAENTARPRRLLRRFQPTKIAKDTLTKIDPLLSWYLLTQHGAESEDDVVGQRTFADLRDSLLQSSSEYRRAYAGFHAINGPLERRRAPTAIDQELTAAGAALLRSVFELGWRFEWFDGESIVSLLERDASNDDITEAIETLTTLEQPPSFASIISPGGYVVAQVGPYDVAVAALEQRQQQAVQDGEAPLPVAECSACVERQGAHLITIVRRQVTGLGPEAFGTDNEDELKARMRLALDPRSWSSATGQVNAEGDQQTGWLASRPIGGWTQGEALKHFDSVLGSDGEAALGPAGTPFATDTLYELVWPGFNKPYGVILKIDFLADGGNSVKWPDEPIPDDPHITVLHKINEQIRIPRSGFPDDRPVGPNVMPLRLDDGYLTLRKDQLPDSAAAGTPETWTLEMYKELDFVDVRGGQVFDAIEELMPFVACAWFDIVQNDWAEYAKTKTNAQITKDIKQKQADLAAIPAPYRSRVDG